jgi:transposase-like protein
MTQKKNTTDLTELLLKCMAQPDPMLSMLEWLCTRLMEAEVSGIVGAEKNAHNPSRRDYRCGYRPRRLDTRMDELTDKFKKRYRSNSIKNCFISAKTPDQNYGPASFLV